MRKLVLALLCLPGLTQAADLAGKWELIGAYREHPDGKRSDDYGSKPRGTLSMSNDGSYALQIYHAERPPFEGDYRTGPAPEYKRLLLAMSTHYGHYSVDAATLTFTITAASNPQWDGAVQKRAYRLTGDVLEWRVPPRPDGDVPISVWRRVAQTPCTAHDMCLRGAVHGDGN